MDKHKDLRLASLRRFAAAITLLNLLGHTVLGFEQPYAQPFVALLAAYSAELLLEWIDSRRLGRRPRFLGPGSTFVDFLLPAHISGMAVGMLLYPGGRLMPIAFAAVAAIASKHVFQVEVNGARRHFFNPSNFGISATLLALPWVGIAQPYMFTENLSSGWRWLLPFVVVCLGSLLNLRLTGRMPLILAWLSAFVLQAAARHFLLGGRFLPALNPLTGVAFLLFTFYMVTDPATTPATPRGQAAFGATVAAVYGLLTAAHQVFGLFFALSLVCAGRGTLLYLRGLAARTAGATGAPAAAGGYGSAAAGGG